MANVTAKQVLDRVDALAPNGMYRHYVEAQIHYANGETARYNSAGSLWNNAFLTYRDYCARTETPPACPVLRLC